MIKRVPLGHLVEAAPVARAGQSNLPVLSMTRAGGLVPQTSIFKKVVASREIAGYKVVRPNQLVVGIHIDEGALGFSGPDQVGIVSPAYTLWNLRAPESVYTPFLHRFIRSEQAVSYFISKYRETAERRGKLTREQFLALEVPLPPLAEQKRIAGILDAADALRAKRREALAQLDTLLQATFLDLFGDPVTNPKGWPTTELAALVAPQDNINYGVVQPGDDHPNGHPLIRVGDLDGGEFNPDAVKLIDPAIERQYARSRLNGRELLVSCVGSIGTVCKVPPSAKGFNIARAVARVPLADSIERDFMLHCLRTAAVQRHFQKETRTVSQPTLNISVIKTAPVIQPPAGLQAEFARFAEGADAQMAQYRAHLAELDTLFASLQSRAFRGEL